MNTLQQYFPVLRDRETALAEIHSREDLRELFYSWAEEYREEFLNICTGVRGVKMLYDTYFKEIMNPDTTPERLNEVLSLILQREVKILHILPNDSAKLAAENSLLVMDIVVQLEDGSIANIEVQKIPYSFPGERSACYSSDLLLRQYKRVHGEKGKAFKYQDIHKVYTIVFLEKSTGVFHQIPDAYIHHSKQVFDTGLKLNLLQEFTFIALDIFRKNYHNEDSSKRTRLDAWLTFLSDDRPEEIMKLLEEYPEFRPLYEQIYDMYQDMGDVMRLFSKELEILDKNTVQYMIDEMQNEIDAQKEQLADKDQQLSEKDQQLEELRKLVAELQGR